VISQKKKSIHPVLYKSSYIWLRYLRLWRKTREFCWKRRKVYLACCPVFFSQERKKGKRSERTLESSGRGREDGPRSALSVETRKITGSARACASSAPHLRVFSG